MTRHALTFTHSSRTPPMAIEVKVPVLPESVSDATIATWHKKAGDAVARDENLRRPGDRQGRAGSALAGRRRAEGNQVRGRRHRHQPAGHRDHRGRRRRRRSAGRRPKPPKAAAADAPPKPQPRRCRRPPPPSRAAAAAAELPPGARFTAEQGRHRSVAGRRHRPQGRGDQGRHRQLRQRQDRRRRAAARVRKSACR